MSPTHEAQLLSVSGSKAAFTLIRFHINTVSWFQNRSGTNRENRKRFYFPDASQIFAIVGDDSRHMKTQICTVGDVGDGFSSLPILCIANCKVWRTVGLAHFPFIWDKRLAIFRYVGKIWDGRETAKSPIVWDFPDIWKLGFNSGLFQETLVGEERVTNS